MQRDQWKLALSTQTGQESTARCLKSQNVWKSSDTRTDLVMKSRMCACRCQGDLQTTRTFSSQRHIREFNMHWSNEWNYKTIKHFCSDRHKRWRLSVDASAHVLPRDLVSQTVSECWCIKYSATSSVNQTPFRHIYLLSSHLPPAFVSVTSTAIILMWYYATKTVPKIDCDWEMCVHVENGQYGKFKFDVSDVHW